MSYLVDQGNTFQYVQARHLDESGMGDLELHDLALNNLSTLAKSKLKVEPYGSIFIVFLDGNFEASLILLDHLWGQSFRHLAPHGFIADLPARDVLAFCDANSLKGIAELRDILARSENGDHLLKPTLFRRHECTWSLYSD